METVLVIIAIVIIIAIVRAFTMTPEEMNNSIWGTVNTALICPHCQTKGKVRTQSVKRKKGISGGKATGAILTGGISMLATGLSRKENTTQAHCDNCNSTWDY